MQLESPSASPRPIHRVSLTADFIVTGGGLVGTCAAINAEGNPIFWDALLHEKVRAEANITLLLNTAVDGVEKSAPDRIAAVTAYCPQNETHYHLAEADRLERAVDRAIKMVLEKRANREGTGDGDFRFEIAEFRVRGADKKSRPSLLGNGGRPPK